MCRSPVRRCKRLDIVRLRRARGRLKKYSGEVIRQHMVHFQLTKDVTLARMVWRLRIRVEV
ncbi:hypothetical protein H5410_006626, partial [Solanum commersonii]